jgi:hypothetical protein
MSIIDISSTMIPARAMTIESMIGFGKRLTAMVARGNNNGIPAAQIIPMPKMIPT